MTEPVLLRPPISKVIVFSEGALVERVCYLPKSASELLISGLPLSLIDGSVETELRPARKDLVTKQVRVNLAVDEDREEATLEGDFRQAQVRHETLRVELHSLTELVGGLRDVSPKARTQTENRESLAPASLGKRLEFLEFQMEQIQYLLAEEQRLSEELEHAEKELAAVAEKMSHSPREIRPEELQKSLQISLSSEPADSETEIIIRYRLPGARWAPAYTARFSPELDSTQLQMRAVVCQATGEDWSGVDLSLSTADPLEWRDMPELKSQRIGRAESAQPKSWKPAPVGSQDLYRGYDRAKDLAFYDAAKAAGSVVFGAAPAQDIMRLIGAESPKSALAPPPPPSPAPACAPEPERDEFCEESGPGEDWSECSDKEYLSRGRREAAPAGGGGWLGGGASYEELKKQAKSELPRKSVLTKTLETVNQRFFQYHHLRLFGAEDSRRGELICLETSEAYLEENRLFSSVTTRAFELATHETELVSQVSAPEGHVFPEDSGFDYIYETASRVDVPSDGQFHSIAIATRSLESAVKYLAVPRKTTQVFRSAEVENSGPNACLRGPVDVFVGENFLHTTSLKSTGPGELMRLGLGVSESVKISRRTEFKETTSGLMSGSTSLPHKFVVEAVNNLKKPIILEVRERLPEKSPLDKDIKIEVDRVEPMWEAFEPEQDPKMENAYRWCLELPPGESKVVSAEYTITFSSKLELVGGNRREPLS